MLWRSQVHLKYCSCVFEVWTLHPYRAHALTARVTYTCGHSEQFRHLRQRIPYPWHYRLSTCAHTAYWPHKSTWRRVPHFGTGALSGTPWQLLMALVFLFSNFDWKSFVTHWLIMRSFISIRQKGNIMHSRWKCFTCTRQALLWVS